MDENYWQRRCKAVEAAAALIIQRCPAEPDATPGFYEAWCTLVNAMGEHDREEYEQRQREREDAYFERERARHRSMEIAVDAPEGVTIEEGGGE